MLTLNEKQKERINEEYPEQKLVYTLSEFSGVEDTQNPYGGELTDYGRCFEPVSYTHLDVYKRQVRIRTVHIGAARTRPKTKTGQTS